MVVVAEVEVEEKKMYETDYKCSNVGGAMEN